MFLSIIIPTWRNTEVELRRCLDSLYVTSLPFEVLLVDDGNEAAYGEMLDRLAKERERLTVLHAPHAGVSAARNLGVSRARGDYVLFVDADDMVTRQFWKDAEEICRRGISFDIIYGRVHSIEKKPFADDLHEGLALREWEKDEVPRLYQYLFAQRGGRDFRGEDGHLFRGPVARMVRREVASRCPFDTVLVWGEDIIWNLDLLLTSPKVATTEHTWYRVWGNPESATRDYKPDLVEQYRNTLSALNRYNRSYTKKDYGVVLFEALADIGKRYFLSPRNPLPWFQKVKEFNQVARSEPFCKVLESDVKMGGKARPEARAL